MIMNAGWPISKELLLVFDTDLYLYFVSSPSHFDDEWGEPGMIDEIVLLVDCGGHRYRFVDAGNAIGLERAPIARLSNSALAFLVAGHLRRHCKMDMPLAKSLEELIRIAQEA